ncbi:MAG: YoaK family protein [Gemmatimonadaceae bacterium]
MPYTRPGAPPERPTIIAARPLVMAGGMSLASVAGYVNAVALGFFHVPVSHMTGAVSRLGGDLASTDHRDLKVTIGIIAGFLVGAILSGTIIGETMLRPGRRYGVVLMIESVLLATATIMLISGLPLGIPIAAMACGLQNAMASSYYGLVIRTTHVTGIVTDIGVMLGHWLRYRRIAAWKLALLASILLSFLFGAIVGSAATDILGMRALFPAAVACAIGGASYGIWAHGLKKRIDAARLRRGQQA